MHMRLTAKQEGFVQDVATGSTLADAYRNNYDYDPNCDPATIWENSSRLMADSNVTARLSELQQMAAERTLVTIQSITEELDASRDLAVSQDDASEMRQSSMAKAKVNGLLVDKVDNKVSLADPIMEMFAQINSNGRRIGS